MYYFLPSSYLYYFSKYFEFNKQYLDKSLFVLCFHLAGPDPGEPLVVVDAGRVVVDGQGAQGDVDAVEADVHADVGVDLLPGEGLVRRRNLSFGRVPAGTVLTHCKNLVKLEGLKSRKWRLYTT